MARDGRYERWLTQEGVDWEFREAVPLKRFNRLVSLENQGRIGARLNQNAVEEYAMAMRAGAEFPPVIANNENKVGLVLISGNHRLEAARTAELPTLDAYVVELDDAFLVERLTRTANTVEGMRPTREELIEQGKYLVHTYSRTISEVSRAVGVPEEALGRAIRLDTIRLRLIGLGVRPDDLPGWVLIRLPAIKNDHALKGVFEVIRDAVLTQESVVRLIKTVNEQGTEAGQLDTIAQWRERPDIKGRIAETRRGTARPKDPPKSELFRAMSRLDGILTRYETLESLQVTSTEERERLQQNWCDLSEQMEALLGNDSGQPKSVRPTGPRSLAG